MNHEKALEIPFFLFPGLACNARLFEPQKNALRELCRVIVPDWIEPRRGETLQDFARRWGEETWKTYYGPDAAENQRLNPEIGCFTGGLSFGGMVSPFVSDVFHEHGLKVHKNVRISTVLYGNQIPAARRFWWSVSSKLPFGGWNFVKILCWLPRLLRGKGLPAARVEMVKQIFESPSARCREVVRMIANWREEERPHDFPSVQIHGTRDRLIPFSCVDSREVLRLNAGHIMTLTQAEEVNALLREILNGNL